MRVWIDQDLCTGDGLCTDHCPEVFVLLDDGISYVRDRDRVRNDPGGAAGAVVVPPRHERAVVDAALDCPGECIFVEPDPEPAVHDGPAAEDDRWSTPSPAAPHPPE
jgi:ferredoxin